VSGRTMGGADGRKAAAPGVVGIHTSAAIGGYSIICEISGVSCSGKIGACGTGKMAAGGDWACGIRGSGMRGMPDGDKLVDDEAPLGLES